MWSFDCGEASDQKARFQTVARLVVGLNDTWERTNAQNLVSIQVLKAMLKNTDLVTAAEAVQEHPAVKKEDWLLQLEAKKQASISEAIAFDEP